MSKPFRYTLIFIFLTSFIGLNYGIVTGDLSQNMTKGDLFPVLLFDLLLIFLLCYLIFPNSVNKVSKFFDKKTEKTRKTIDNVATGFEEVLETLLKVGLFLVIGYFTITITLKILGGLIRFLIQF